MKSWKLLAIVLIVLGCRSLAQGGVGDPQIRTDHPWYPGELACSTFERLFATQAELYQRVVGVKPTTDEQKALAAWLWRNTHYCARRGRGRGPLGQGLHAGRRPADARVLDRPVRPRLRPVRHHAFAVGRRDGGAARPQSRPRRRRRRAQLLRGLPDRRRVRRGQVGAARSRPLHGHLRPRRHGPALAPGDPEGLEAAHEPAVSARHGSRWLVCGLHPDDGGVYRRYEVAEYLPGYAGAPPMVHLRRGETLRRYFAAGPGGRQDLRLLGPQLQHGRHPRPGALASPGSISRRRCTSRATGAGYKPGQARYANAVYTYKPDFADGDYREGVIDEERPARRLRVLHAVHHRRHAAGNEAVGHLRAGLPQRPGAARQGRLPRVALDRSGPDLAGLRPVPRRHGPDRSRQGSPAVLPAPGRRGQGAGGQRA